MTIISPVRPGVLHVVATPIGNLEIYSSRRQDSSGSRYHRRGRHAPYKETSQSSRNPYTAYRLLSGKGGGAREIAHYSPAIRQEYRPGHRRRHSLHIRSRRHTCKRRSREGVRIIPVPGPSALAAALSCAGLDSGAFLFLGFPPAKKNRRKTLLKSLLAVQHAAVFYESPRRIDALLQDALEVLGDRRAFGGES